MPTIEYGSEMMVYEEGVSEFDTVNYLSSEISGH